VRGIAYIGGEGPGPAWCGKLAAGAGIVAAADSGLQAAEDAGLRPDWIIGDMDSLDDVRRLENYPPDRVLRYPHDKDYTDTELALKLLWGKGCDEVWLVGGGGGRTDHVFALRALFEREPCPDRWVTAADDIRRVKEGSVLAFSSVEVPPGGIVSVFPLGDGPWAALSTGLKWPLDGLAWTRGAFGISNEAPHGSFSITAKRGRFMVLVPLGIGI
jgi:thiamine pyrophosphokinase